MGASVNARRSRVDGTIIFNYIRAKLEQFGLSYVDMRTKGGALWIIDSPEVTRERLEACEDIGNCIFKFCENGSRSTGHRAGWFTKVRA